MADTKISGLTALTGANTASGDLLTIVDVSDTTMAATGTNKKITLTELQGAPVSAGTANGVLYLNGSKVATSGSALTFDGTTLSLTTAGTNALTINTPDYGYVDLKNGTSTLRFQNNNSIPRVATVGNYPLVFAINEVEQMRLTSTGLGIGTSSPATKLEVAGTTPSIRLNSGGTPASLYGLEITNGTTVDGYFRSRGATGETQIGSGRSAGWGGYITFYTDTTERMRLDSSGNLGIGTSSPTSAASTTTLEVANATTARVIVNSTGGRKWGIYTTSSDGRLGIYDYTASADRLVIDSSGNLSVGTTSTYGGAKVTFERDSNSTIQVLRSNSYTSGTNYYMQFFADATETGKITSNGTNNTYATSSDYRLKENIQPMQNALGVVAQLNPVTYTWKVNGADGQGFIAHELQAVVPDCVVGEKDEVDADGNPVYQGIDTSFLVATLTAAIKEQQALIESLTTRIAALEGK